MSRWLAWILAAGITAPLAAQDTNDVWYQRAEALIRDLEAGRFGAAEKRMHAQVVSQLDSARLAVAWGQITSAAGSLQTLSRKQVVKQGEMQVVEMNAAFQRQTLMARVVMQADGQVVGLWFLPPEGGGASQAAQPERPPYAEPARFTEEAATIGTAPWQLAGTWSLPVGATRVPAVVLVHGSGPHDQDETIGPNKPFRDLAWGLASRGIGVLRYEKRTRAHGTAFGSGKVTVDQEVVEDAIAALALARSHPRVDAERVVVLGHSLGGMLAPEIALRDGQTAGVVLLAGANRTLAEMLEEQLTYIASLPESAAPEIQAQLRAVLDTARLLRTHALAPDVQAIGAPASYVYDLDARKPLEMVQRLNVPILILQGGRDYQVTEADLERWKGALSSQGRSTFRLYSDLNHLFIRGTGKATPQEYARAGYVDVRVIDDITSWIQGAVDKSKGRT
jgi:hypothetical protein